MKIAHISDLHIDFFHKKANNIRSYRLLEYIVENKYDHVVISGDITENSDNDSFLLARSMFKKFGLLDSEKLTLTIGNHDIYGGVHLAEDVINFPSRCKNTNYINKVSEFKRYFNETFPEALQNSNSLFPFIKELDSVILLSLNSIAEYSYMKNPFASNGKISGSQLKKAAELIESCGKNKKRIVVSHHHFSRNIVDHVPGSGSIWHAVESQTMKLRRKKKILTRMKEMEVDIILHGHLHENSAYSKNSISLFNAGGSVLNCDASNLYVNSINIVPAGNIEQSFVCIETPALHKPSKTSNKFVPSFRSSDLQKSEAICLN